MTTLFNIIISLIDPNKGQANILSNKLTLLFLFPAAGVEVDTIAIDPVIAVLAMVEP